MSWRESSDPRCPECGGKIAATASYCMHCDANLNGDSNTSEDSVLSDDEYGAVDSGDQSEMPSKEWGEPDNVTEKDTTSSSGSTASNSEPVAESTGDRHKIEALAHSLTSFLWTDVPEPEGVPDNDFTAPLWMRLPVGLVAGIFVFIGLFFYTISLLGPLPDFVNSILLFGGFFGIMAWLVRKRLPSDILGDAAYALAAMLYSYGRALVITDN